MQTKFLILQWLENTPICINCFWYLQLRFKRSHFFKVKKPPTHKGSFQNDFFSAVWLIHTMLNFKVMYLFGSVIMQMLFSSLYIYSGTLNKTPGAKLPFRSCRTICIVALYIFKNTQPCACLCSWVSRWDAKMGGRKSHKLESCWCPPFKFNPVTWTLENFGSESYSGIRIGKYSSNYFLIVIMEAWNFRYLNLFLGNKQIQIRFHWP